MCGGSPLISVDEFLFSFCEFFFSCRGDYTGEEFLNTTLVLPSVYLDDYSCGLFLFIYMSGRFTG